jgi:long-chain acyl-CoA synthetase
MGGKSSVQHYGGFVGEEKQGETRVLRHPEFIDKPLSTEPIPGINTIWKAFEYTVKLHGERPFLGTRRQEGKELREYEWITYKQVDTLVRNFSAGLIKLNFCPEIQSNSNGLFRFLGIYSRNNYKFVISDLASHLFSVTVVTIYDSLGDHTIEYIIDQTSLTTMCMESRNLSKLTKLKKENKAVSLQNIIIYDSDDQKNIKEAQSLGYNVVTFEEVLKAGEGQSIQFNPCTADTIATFCYTSGTTGTPKGAMISHGGLLADVSCLNNSDAELFETDRHLSYLPLAHVMERVVMTTCITKGISVGFYTGNPANIISDAVALKPTIFIGVPKVFMRVYDNIVDTISKKGMITRTLINRAINTKLANYISNGYLTHSIWDRLVCNKFKSALGGNVRLMMTGSAPISQQTLNYLKVCFSCPILEGYGQTECCAASCITSISDYRGGNVGGPISAAEIKLVDAPALNYLSTDKDENGNSAPRGEICIRGPILFKGYFNAEDKTKEAVDSEGWLHTGDVGIILPNHTLRIIDRVKNIFKLSIGEYIAPEKLENLYCKGHYINQIFVHGESTESVLVAIVYPKKEHVVSFLESKGLNATKDNVAQYYNNPELKGEILKDLEKLGRENEFKGFEIIKKVYLTDEMFTIENDLLTPTMKLKRHEAKKRYLTEIKNLYSEK